MLKVAGQWVWPGEVEAAVASVPSVVEAACVPVLDAVWPTLPSSPTLSARFSSFAARHLAIASARSSARSSRYAVRPGADQ